MGEVGKVGGGGGVDSGAACRSRRGCGFKSQDAPMGEHVGYELKQPVALSLIITG